MKNSDLRNKINIPVLILIASLMTCPTLTAQDQEGKTEDDSGFKPVKTTFESQWIIDNHTVMVPTKKTLEFVIQHRFGTIRNGIKDLWGLYATSNIRLGLSYTLFDKLGLGKFKGPLSIGVGSTKANFVQDLNWKYSLLQQTRNNRIPVSVTYFGNVAMATEDPTSELPNGNTSDRFSFFNQIMIARQFSSRLSLQIASSVSHFNVVEKEMNNDHFAVAFSGRYKFSPQSSILINVDQPITKHQFYNPQPNVSFGFEISTSSHAFQVFGTCFNSIVPQYNNMYNQNDPWDKGYLIGFNITRLWSF